QPSYVPYGAQAAPWLAIQPTPAPPGYKRGPLGFEQIVPSPPGSAAAAGGEIVRHEANGLPPGTIMPTEVPPGGNGGEPWIWPILAFVGGLLLGDDNGNGEEPGSALVPMENGGALVPYAGAQGYGGNWQAFADFGGFGKGSPQAEGWIAANRTTDGTGVISAETFRAWDPVQQRYYQLHGKNPYSNITLMPGRVLPGIGGFITKTWVTHAWRKDGSLASTQMAMTSTGRMISLSETGVMKNWRPYRSIVIGKSLTTRNLRRVSTRVKSHAKSLKKILSILK
ncbi:unnamed protein product, partial [marine sediment metagenome]